MTLISRIGLLRGGVCLAVVSAIIWGLIWYGSRMPGMSYRGALPTLTAEQTVLREALRRDVIILAARIGCREMECQPAKLKAAADFIQLALIDTGLKTTRQPFVVGTTTVYNIEAELPGSNPSEIVVVGAHYDTEHGSPGADDNASGVAALLALARAYSNAAPTRTLRFVAFVNEEWPYFRTPNMGSRVYAAQCRARKENIVAMLSLEMLGYYSEKKGSQSYPFPFGLFYPHTANYIGFVGNFGSRPLVQQAIGAFRAKAQFPSEGIAISFPITGLSDHSSFWHEGYPGAMVTDTSFLRYKTYHTDHDMPGQLDFDGMARVVDGLGAVVRDLAGIR